MSLPVDYALSVLGFENQEEFEVFVKKSGVNVLVQDNILVLRQRKR